MVVLSSKKADCALDSLLAIRMLPEWLVNSWNTLSPSPCHSLHLMQDWGLFVHLGAWPTSKRGVYCTPSGNSNSWPEFSEILYRKPLLSFGNFVGREGVARGLYDRMRADSFPVAYLWWHQNYSLCWGFSTGDDSAALSPWYLAIPGDILGC